MEIRCQVYPSLLNSWGRYMAGLNELEDLINQINRVPRPQTEAQMDGIIFETDFVTYLSSGILPEGDDRNVVFAEMARYIPDYATTQQYVEFVHKGIKFYGYEDIEGEGRIIDIKTTGNYSEPRYMTNFQNLYLYARRHTCRSMEYLITDFHRVYREVYHLSSYDFTPLLSSLEHFSEWLFEHEHLITDTKIFCKNG